MFLLIGCGFVLRSVRVKFFQEPVLENLQKQICVYADFPLEQDGTLDFRVVRNKWGLTDTTVRKAYDETLMVQR
jgi:hypothetical protein